MKRLVLLSFLLIFYPCEFNNLNYTYINDNNNFAITEAVYVINHKDWKPTYDPKKRTKIDPPHFDLIKSGDNNDIYFYIKNCNDNSYLSADQHSKLIKTQMNKNETDYMLWKIIHKITKDDKLIYYIQNKKTLKYWMTIDDTAFNVNLVENFDYTQLNEKNEFFFIELYKKADSKESSLLDKEPIDVCIKFIDLTDKTLNRSGINQIKKDFDNEELRYSIRSIIKNIPWIRKIFLLMPNEKVRYFKPIEEIKERIVYVKDKDVLGFDSANIYPFLYNLFKMKQFGMAENFIYMDDDYFIAQPIKKSELFYEENGVILPGLLSNEFKVMNLNNIENDLSYHIKKTRNEDAHTEFGYYQQHDRSLLFMYKIFGNDDKRYGKNLIYPTFTHNAMPLKMSEIYEIYNHIITKYEYINQTMHSLKRSVYDLNFQSLYTVYVKNKYDRKAMKIKNSFYDLIYAPKIKNDIINNKIKLFVINTSTRNYRDFHYQKEKELLNELFPEKTPYELDNYEITNKIINNSNEIKNKNCNINNNDNNNNSIKQTILLDLFVSVYKNHLEEEIIYLRYLCKISSEANHILISIMIFTIIIFIIKIKKSSF